MLKQCVKVPKIYEKKEQGLDLEGDLEPEEYNKAI
jgi:hypothetical protein